MAGLALAGIAAPLLFTALVILQGALQPDYSHVRWPISALAAWPYGWIQALAFYAYGALVIAFAPGLHRSILATKGGAAGPALIAVCGIGAVVAGLFPWVRVGGVLEETPGHVAGAVLHFLGAAAGLIVVSGRMRRDARWRGLAGLTLAGGIAMLITFVALAALGIPETGPLHPWAGAVQRIAVAIWFACLLVIATRCWKLSGAPASRIEATLPRERPADAPRNTL